MVGRRFASFGFSSVSSDFRRSLTSVTPLFRFAKFSDALQIDSF